MLPAKRVQFGFWNKLEYIFKLHHLSLLGRKPDSCNILWGSKHSQAGNYSGEYI